MTGFVVSVVGIVGARRLLSATEKNIHLSYLAHTLYAIRHCICSNMGGCGIDQSFVCIYVLSVGRLLYINHQTNCWTYGVHIWYTSCKHKVELKFKDQVDVPNVIDVYLHF